MLVWIERLGRVGEDELFGFGLSPEAVTGEILLDPLGNTRIRKKNKEIFVKFSYFSAFYSCELHFGQAQTMRRRLPARTQAKSPVRYAISSP